MSAPCGLLPSALIGLELTLFVVEGANWCSRVNPVPSGAMRNTVPAAHRDPAVAELRRAVEQVVAAEQERAGRADPVGDAELVKGIDRRPVRRDPVEQRACQR